MDNQHKIIKGYRDLSQAELDMINDVESKGVELAALIEKLRQSVNAEFQTAFVIQGEARGDEARAKADEQYRRVMASTAEANRWIQIGQDHLQQGLMALTRAVARPENF